MELRTLRRLLLCLAASSTLTPSVSSQNVWIVDAGGTGHAIDIRFAVTMAADGDAILVRPGIYTGTFLPRDKSLTLVGQPGAEVRVGPAEGGFVLRDLEAGKRVSIRGFHIKQRFSGGGEAALYFSGNRGAVHIEAIVVDSMEVGTLDIHSSVAVTAVNVVMQGARQLNVQITRSSVAMVNCACASVASIMPALMAEGSHLALVDCSFRSSTPGLEGAQLLACSTVVAGRSAGGYHAAPGTASASAIAVFGGDLSIDPTVPLVPNNAPPIRNSGGTLVSRLVPTLQIDALANCTLAGPSGAASATFVMFPAAALASPFGSIWGEVGSMLLVDQGFLSGSLRTIPIPPSRGTLGRPLLLQSALLDAAGQVSLSTPLPFTY